VKTASINLAQLKWEARIAWSAAGFEGMPSDLTDVAANEYSFFPGSLEDQHQLRIS
jgi:hypothetical protein